MKKTNSGLVIMREVSANNLGGATISLTRKTMKSGKVKYGVVLTNPRSGLHTRLKTFNGIKGAWDLQKALLCIR